jgi:osmoprotectant transport system substrate-binding protein
MRYNRTFALGAALLSAVLVLGACSKSGGGGATSSGPKPTVASLLVLGGPPECPTRPFCEPGLKSSYGITFKSFKPLDTGGPQTVAALSSGAIQVALLFSTDPTIADKGWVALVDDKHLQNADIITPVVRTAALTDDIKTLLNGVSAKLTTENIVPLIKAVQEEHQDAATVAKGFLQQNGLLSSPSTTGQGKTLTVGVSAAFAENQIVAQMYAQVLQNAGYTVKTQLDLASREISDKALQSGQIDIKPEYLASELAGPLANAADKSSGDVNAEVAALAPLLATKGITLLDPSQANDTNVFVVTKATADKYGLVNISDLAKPA